MKLDLPNFFFADLPPEAELTSAMVAEACRTLRRNREQFLAARSTQSIVELLCTVAEEWMSAASPFRQAALNEDPAATGFSAPTLAAGLDNFFRQFTPENFNTLLVQDLGHAARLDAPVSGPGDDPQRRSSLAMGPGLLVHIAAGNLPPPTLMSMTLGLLARSAQFVKCSTGAAFLPRLFAHSLHEADPKIGACLEIATWPGGNAALEAALFAGADCVTVTGSDETIAAVRERLPARTRLIGYGHRISFGYVTRDMLTPFQLKRAVAAAARDVTAWDQLGCLSPHVLYVEDDGKVNAEIFADLLAKKLAEHELAEPRGRIAVEEAAHIASLRAVYEVRAAHSQETRLWTSENSTAWTVVYEAEPRFQQSCLNRFIYVKSAASLAVALHSAEMVRGQVSTVGLAALPAATEPVVRELAHWGVTRVCPLGQMQNPPLTWRHDGRPALGDLVTWVDWER